MRLRAMSATYTACGDTDATPDSGSETVNGMITSRVKGPGDGGFDAPNVTTGGVPSVEPVTVIVKVCTGLVSAPPFAVPPRSCSWTLTVAVPFVLAAGVYVSVPPTATAGCAENSALLSFETMKFSV